jgi:hypothetical protein
MRKYVIGIVIGILLSSVAVVLAGNLNPTGGPTEASDQMYTLEQIYDRLDSGADSPKMTTFAEPGSGPGSSMHTLDEIMAKAPLAHTDGATATHVLTGKPFWGLHSSAWATQTGTMADNGAVTLTPTTTQQTIAEGYHDGSGYVAGDVDLVTGNIRSGVTIFGVSGDPNVVDTSSGDAAAGDILSGKKAWVGGSEVTGTLPNTRVPKTGQTGCWDVDGNPISCSGTAQDGEYQMGVLPEWAPTADRAYTAYGATGTRFTDNGDGTVTDIWTGLIWLKDPACFGGTYERPMLWADAFTWAKWLHDGCEICGGTNYDCNLSDGSNPGDWRLPNINELHSLFGPDVNWDYLPEPFDNVKASSIYWSSTTDPDDHSHALVEWLQSWPKTTEPDWRHAIGFAWPVRGGGQYEGPPPEAPPWGASFGGYNRTSFTNYSGTQFTDNGDGTVTDDLTGFVWLKNADCFSDNYGFSTWPEAVTETNTLEDGQCGLTDGSSAGDWRLPTIDELRSLFDPDLSPPYLPDGHPFTNVFYYGQVAYWSSTPSTDHPDHPSYAWSVDLANSVAYYDITTTPIYNGYWWQACVWPVRDGP